MRQALSPAVAEKYAQLLAVLGELSGAMVAFSGGIDSSLVAYVAHQVLGVRMVAVTSTSASLPSSDGHLTQTLAQEWGMPHRLIVTNELENPNYLANPTNRCYFCKTTLYHHLSTLGEDQPFSTILNGVIAEDISDFRPGLKAAKEYQVRAPLAECGFNKDDVRRLAFYLGLRNAFKPQSACLSSRVPYGTAISAPLLGQIERAEMGVRAVLEPLGFSQLRVRHHGVLGRIELEGAAIPTALKHHADLGRAVLDAGYTVAGLDINGFYSGALNSVWRMAQTTAPSPSKQQRIAMADRALQTLGFVHTAAHSHGWGGWFGGGVGPSQAAARRAGSIGQKHP